MIITKQFVTKLCSLQKSSPSHQKTKPHQDNRFIHRHTNPLPAEPEEAASALAFAAGAATVSAAFLALAMLRHPQKSTSIF